MECNKMNRKFGPSNEAQELVSQLASVVDRPWYKSREPDNVSLSIIARLVELDEITAAPAIARFLVLSSELASAAKRAIEALLSHRPTSQLQRLDEWCRGRGAQFKFLEEWRSLQPTHLTPFKSSAHVMGLASFHSNGRVREQAVKHLANHSSGEELTYLLIRTNDWVSQVQKLAEIEVMNRLGRAAYDGALIANLALARSMETKTRHGLDGIVARLRRALIDSPNGLVAAAASADSDYRTRREAYCIAWTLPEPEKARHIERGLDDNDCVIASQAAAQACKLSDTTVRLKYFQRMLGSRWAGVRLMAVRALATGHHANAEAVLQEALFDQSRSIRSAARYYLRKSTSAVKPIQVYQDELRRSTGRRLVAAVDGVGECGEACHAESVAAFIGSKSPSLDAAALQATANLDMNRVGDSLPTALTSPSPRVSHAARQIICRTGAGTASAAQVFANSDYVDHVRLNALRILNSQSKWDRLPALMQALTDPVPKIRRFADWQLHRWRTEYNKSFTQPTERQRTVTLTLLNTLVVAQHPIAQFVRGVLCDE